MRVSSALRATIPDLLDNNVEPGDENGQLIRLHNAQCIRFGDSITPQNVLLLLHLPIASRSGL